MLEYALQTNLDSRAIKGSITFEDLSPMMQVKINTLSSDIAGKVNTSALKAFSLNSGPGISKADFQAALQTEFNAKLTGSATTSGNKLASIIVNGQTLVMGGYLQTQYINVDDLTVNKALGIGEFVADGLNLKATDSYYTDRVLTLSSQSVHHASSKGQVFLDATGGDGYSAGMVTLWVMGSPTSNISNVLLGRFLPNVDTERRISLSFAKLTGDVAWVYRTCLTLSNMPFLNHLTALPTVVNSIGTGNYGVRWDARTGCFYVQ